jgi:membrane dipeptidase
MHAKSPAETETHRDALDLHRDAAVVDLHNDLILLVDHCDELRQPQHFREYWLPELRAGGVDVQVLPVSVGERFQSEGALRRTLLLIERIHRIVDEHPDEVALCLTGADIDEATSAGKIAFVIAIEGAHALGQDPALTRTLWRVGVRMLAFTHLGRTFLADGGGLDATSNGRLTAHGIEVFQELERLGIVFDLSHLGTAGVDHVLELATRPLFATHSACRAIVDIHRNLTDDQIRRIADVDGVIGIAAAIPPYIDPRDPSAERVVDHIEHIAALTSFDHVAIGPDFIDDLYQHLYGGWVLPNLLDVEAGPGELARPSDLPKVTETMVRRGFAESDIRKVLGENALRVLREVMGSAR